MGDRGIWNYRQVDTISAQILAGTAAADTRLFSLQCANIAGLRRRLFGQGG
jgi:hypothetical protein